MQHITEEYIFHGRVQGVGFRWQTATIARDYPVTGTVRNQVDGTVRLVVTGSQQNINSFITAVTTHLNHYIKRTDTNTLPLETFADFSIDRS